MMVSNVVGNFKDFSGTIEYDEKSKTLQSIKGIVEVKSINTENEKRDKHLRADDFFAAEKYPQISFESTKIQGDEVIGNFTMRGVTKEPCDLPWWGFETQNCQTLNTLDMKYLRSKFA